MSDLGAMDNSLRRDLPPEMVAHVLSLLPVKSLCRFKCVSPSWKSLISSPHFAKTHLHITNTSNKPQKYILIPWTISNALYSIDFGAANPTAEKVDFPLIGNPDRGLQFSGSCNGLVLVYDQGRISNFLLNPSTRECKKLPESPFFDISSSARIKLSPIGCHVFLAGLGYVSSTDDYKVVMLLYRGYYDSESDFDGDVNDITEVTVYSLKTDSWKRIQDCHYTPVDFRRGFCFNERLHWLSWRTGDYGSMVVVAFNLSDEIFREVHLPATFDDNEVEYHDMAVLGSCLCLVIWSFSNKVEVWMMKKYGVRESWIKFTIANHGMPQGNLLYLSAADEVVLRTYGCDVYLVMYDPKKGRAGDMLVCGLPTKIIEGGNYIETLISPNHGGSVFR